MASNVLRCCVIRLTELTCPSANFRKLPNVLSKYHNSGHQIQRQLSTKTSTVALESPSNGLGLGELLNLSDSCLVKLKTFDSKMHLRLAVDGGGCSGFQYSFEMDETLNPDDIVVEKEGVRVVLDKESLEFVKGSTLDYHEELIRSSFRIINNPQAGQGCSCGASFSLKL